MASQWSTNRRMFLTGRGRSPVFPMSEPNVAGALVIAISAVCLARAGVFCMSCRDACPQQAIGFRPRIGGFVVPELTEDSCTGCGACIAPCPTQAIVLVERFGEVSDG
jgi:ferredoxin-type protein NapF